MSPEKKDQLFQNAFLRAEAGEGSDAGISQTLLALIVIREEILDDVVEQGGWHNASDKLADAYERQVGQILAFKADHNMSDPPHSPSGQ